MLELGIALTLHFAMNEEYNEVHPYMKFSNQNYNVGAFYNSERTISFYTGKEFTFDVFTVDIGIVTGYYDAKIAPMMIIKKK